MADQTDKIGAYKGELDRIKGLLRGGGMPASEAQQLLRRGRELERIIDDASLIRGVKTATQKPVNPFGADTSEAAIEAEEEAELDEETGEELDSEGNVIQAEEDENQAETETAKNELAKEEVAQIQDDGGFEKNTQKGQEGKGLAAPANANAEGQSAAPAAAPSAKPEGSDANIAGGKALVAKKPSDAQGISSSGIKAAAAKTDEGANKESSDKSSASTQAKQLGARIQAGVKESIKNAKEKIKKQLSKEAMKALMKSPLFWWIVGGILALALIAAVAFAIFGSLWGTGNSGTTGSTYVQAADPIKDKNWLARLLQYSGDKEISDAKSAETIAVVRKALTDIQGDTTLSSETRGKATVALSDLSTYENAQGSAAKKAAATKLLADIKNITDIYFACSSLYTNTYYSIGPSAELDSLKKDGVLPATLKIKDTTYTNPEYPVDPRLCGLLTAMADPNTGIDHAKIPLLAISFRGSHSSKANERGYTSSHYCGRGVDINDPRVRGDEVALAAEIKRWIWLNKDLLQKNKLWPEEMFGGPPYTQQINDKVEGKNKQYDNPNHIHIGFGGCKKQ